nr:MAG TPA_asm: hypothetical protein [Caudoviricetes sp.]
MWSVFIPLWRFQAEIARKQRITLPVAITEPVSQMKHDRRQRLPEALRYTPLSSALHTKRKRFTARRAQRRLLFCRAFIQRVSGAERAVHSHSRPLQ